MGDSTVGAAEERFAAAGLPFPYVPPELVPGFAELGDWVYGTRPDPAWLYGFDDYVAEGVTTEVDDYVLIGQAGHGFLHGCPLRIGPLLQAYYEHPTFRFQDPKKV